MENNDTNNDLSRLMKAASQLAEEVIQRGIALRSTQLDHLAASSPLAGYLRTLSTDAARQSTQSLLTLLASILAPQAIPEPSGKGRKGNSAERFAAACALPWHQIRTERLGEVRAELLRRGLSVNTINRSLSALRGVLEQCWRSRQLDLEDLERAKSALGNVKGETLPKGRHVGKSDLQLLMASCEKDCSPSGARDALLVALLAAGLRRAEVASARLEDIDLGSGEILVRGKGRKQREVAIAGGCRAALDEWMKYRGDGPGALLFAVNKSGVVQTGSGMTPQAVYKALMKRSRQSGVEVSPHDLRRTLIGNAFSAGVDVSTIQKIVGHSSPTTTSRYDRRDKAIKRSVMDMLAVQYEPKATTP
jgi:integrase